MKMCVSRSPQSLHGLWEREDNKKYTGNEIIARGRYVDE